VVGSGGVVRGSGAGGAVVVWSDGSLDVDVLARSVTGVVQKLHFHLHVEGRGDFRRGLCSNMLFAQAQELSESLSSASVLETVVQCLQ
jgi:hypothetical protein